MASRRIIVMPFGSTGDVHPFVEVALALRRRDRDVSVMVNPHFAPLLARVDLPFVPTGTAEEYHALLGHPDLWHERRGVRVLADAVRRHGAETIRLLRIQGGDGAPLLVAPGAAFGARIVHEALGFPLVTLNLERLAKVICALVVARDAETDLDDWLLDDGGAGAADASDP